MQRKILVLGAGMVGGAMALDLAKDERFKVTVVDYDADALAKVAAAGKLQVLHRDLKDPASVLELAGAFDMVVNAVPGFMGFQTFKAVIQAGKDIVDISFFIEDPFTLDEMAREQNVTAVMDCGVAPGMCNVLIGDAHQLLDATENVVYYVGGLPELREWPYEYKAVFSPVDVLEEYTRPARFIIGGTTVVKPALSDPELMNFPGIGTLEAFNTDGLRSLVRTIKAPNMLEKTLRYPGHIEKMRILRETGFFSKEEVSVGGVKVRPIDLTSSLLFPKWKFTSEDVDITVMKVVVEGLKDGKHTRFTWDLFDRKDEKTGIHSMARCTGYTATVALRMITDGVFTQKGVIVPEYFGAQSKCVDYLLKGLRDRGVVYKEKVEEF
ncbi:MAG: saccharopine dehydrogenase NADP-binding domain-containing protein [Bacteroidetes bacterium]|nr:saccharopine dehydrogenase NADP-binding domain-containing protein [Bacteroidota bacterium]